MAEQTNTLRQADNNAHIEGLLLENRLEYTKINDKEHGEIPAIRGEIDVETGKDEVHTVGFFMKSVKKDGTENGIYKSLETVMNEYNSVAKVGRDDADKVRISSGEVRLNEYYGQDGMLKSFPKLHTNFVNRLTEKDEFDPKASFEVEAVVKNVVPELKGDEETGRALVNAYIPMFAGQVIPFTFVVADEGAVSYVEENYEAGNTVKIYGDIINRVVTKVIKEEVAFGKPQEKKITNTTREYVITGGSEPYEEDSAKAYKMDALKKALAEREVYLDNMKKRQEEKKNGGAKEEKKGFDTKATKEKKSKISTDDLPF